MMGASNNVENVQDTLENLYSILAKIEERKQNENKKTKRSNSNKVKQLEE